MKNEEIQIAIAESCGWIYIEGEEPTYGGTYKQCVWKSPTGKCYPANHKHKDSYGLPDYLNDLNAMHEAEKTLHSPYSVYVATLQTVCGSAGNNAIAWPYIHATAAQRAEAFLKTIGKWKD